MKKTFTIIIAVVCALVCVFSFVGCNDDEPIVEPPVGSLMTAESKQAVFNGSYGEQSETSGFPSQSTTYYGVGRTLNVIEDEYITVSAGHAKVFDADKLLALNWRKTDTGKMEAISTSGNSMKKFYANLSAKFNRNFGAKIGNGSFSAGIDNKFGFSADAAYAQTANEIYFTFSQAYAAKLIEIDEYYNLSQFEDILSAEVLTDAGKVKSGAMSPSAFIYKYGTHAVLAGYYGGRVDCNYYLRNIGKQWSVDAEIGYQNEISAKIGEIFSASESTEFSIRAKLGLNESNAQEVFSASSIGGDNFKANSVSAFIANYGAWVDSMNGNKDYGNLVELPARSLVAIWDLLPSEYSEAAVELSSYFDEIVDSANKEFLNKYARHFTEPEEKGDTSDFDSGYGTASKPYIVTTKEEFANMSKEDRNNKSYKLGCSINLGVWDSPFEFSGTLDGNGYTITYTQTLGTKGDYFGGLFTELSDATVKNLKLDVKISRDMERGDTGMVGALAGISNGICNVSRVYVSGVISIGNYSGYDYVGGLFGQFLGGTIEQCVSTAQITNWARNARTGGICGYACPSITDVKISDCYNTGNLKSSSNWTTAFGGRTSGGIAGQVRGHNAFTLEIRNCYNDSKVQLEWTG